MLLNFLDFFDLLAENLGHVFAVGTYRIVGDHFIVCTYFPLLPPTKVTPKTVHFVLFVFHTTGHVPYFFFVIAIFPYYKLMPANTTFEFYLSCFLILAFLWWHHPPSGLKFSGVVASIFYLLLSYYYIHVYVHIIILKLRTIYHI